MRELRTSLWGISAFALGYLLPGTLRLPTLTYDPVRRTVGVGAQVSGVAMRYYGDLLWACAAGLCAAAVVWNSRRRPRPVGVLAGAALSLVALDAAFYLSRLLAGV
ncbi:MAG: hypothetical protein ACJ79H_09740 [Myxococcales bacterium]